MRRWFRLLYACALGLAALSGCSGSGGGDEATGGDGGSAGMGGSGGVPTMCTIDSDCDDDDPCTDDTCTVQGACEYANAEDGTECTGGSCVFGECQPVDEVFPCTEQGVRDAIAAGGGPIGFSCDGPQTVTTESEIIIDNDVILDGLGTLTLDGAETHRVLSVGMDVTAELRRLTVTRGAAPAGSGGGILSSGTLTLTESTVTNSTALRFGGGIANFGTMAISLSRASGNSAGENGGGVFNTFVLTMSGSTVSGNMASLAGGGVGNTGRSLVLTGCTVSGNEAAQNGGGISNANVLMLDNSTLSGNSASNDGGGIRNDSVMTILHTTLSENTAQTGSAIGNPGVVMNMGSSLIDGECSGTALGSDGYNVESPGDTCGLSEPTDSAGVSAGGLGLGPLQDNGGLTETHALMSGSVGVDRIPAEMCEAEEDQRGVARPQGDGCDAGAFEREP